MHRRLHERVSNKALGYKHECSKRVNTHTRADRNGHEHTTTCDRQTESGDDATTKDETEAHRAWGGRRVERHPGKDPRAQSGRGRPNPPPRLLLGDKKSLRRARTCRKRWVGHERSRHDPHARQPSCRPRAMRAGSARLHGQSWRGSSVPTSAWPNRHGRAGDRLERPTLCPAPSTPLTSLVSRAHGSRPC